MQSVILFKSEADGPDKFLKVLENTEFDARSISCLSFQFKNLTQLEDHLKSDSAHDGMILTSPRAVKALHEVKKLNSEILENWKLKENFSVGEATSLLASELLDLDTSGRDTGNAQKLSELIIEKFTDRPSKGFLCPSGNLRLGILERNLNEVSISIEYVEVYETIEHPQLAGSIEELKDIKIDFIVFFSPSGVDFSLPHLKRHGIDLQQLKIIAIGPSTKKCLVDHELQCYAECDKPNSESLLAALRTTPTTLSSC